MQNAFAPSPFPPQNGFAAPAPVNAFPPQQQQFQQPPTNFAPQQTGPQPPQPPAFMSAVPQQQQFQQPPTNFAPQQQFQQPQQMFQPQQQKPYEPLRIQMNQAGKPTHYILGTYGMAHKNQLNAVNGKKGKLPPNNEECMTVNTQYLDGVKWAIDIINECVASNKTVPDAEWFKTNNKFKNAASPVSGSTPAGGGFAGGMGGGGAPNGVTFDAAGCGFNNGTRLQGSDGIEYELLAALVPVAKPGNYLHVSIGDNKVDCVINAITSTGSLEATQLGQGDQGRRFFDFNVLTRSYKLRELSTPHQVEVTTTPKCTPPTPPQQAPQQFAQPQFQAPVMQQQPAPQFPPQQQQPAPPPTFQAPQQQPSFPPQQPPFQPPHQPAPFATAQQPSFPPQQSQIPPFQPPHQPAPFQPPQQPASFQPPQQPAPFQPPQQPAPQQPPQFAQQPTHQTNQIPPFQPPHQPAPFQPPHQPAQQPAPFQPPHQPAPQQPPQYAQQQQMRPPSPAAAKGGIPSHNIGSGVAPFNPALLNPTQPPAQAPVQPPQSPNPGQVNISAAPEIKDHQPTEQQAQPAAPGEPAQPASSDVPQLV